MTRIHLLIETGIVDDAGGSEPEFDAGQWRLAGIVLCNAGFQVFR